jgi:hypothetical protein
VLVKLLGTLLKSLLGGLLGLALLGVGYLLFAYHFTYSRGESVGFVQKISYKGWLCKTWEGEQVRALSVVPAIPEKFEFTVRDPAVVDKINASIGQKIVLDYEQHRGLPRCFGDSEHFVTDVRPAPGP